MRSLIISSAPLAWVMTAILLAPTPDRSYGGYYYNYDVGYVRDSSGAVTRFTVPGSKTTSAVAVNDSGEVTGSYYSSPTEYGMYVRDASGHFTTYHLPITVVGINNAGVVAGYNYDDNTAYLVDTSTGNVTTFSQALGWPVTRLVAINNSGTVVGWAGGFDFVRDASGAATRIDPPSGYNQIDIGTLSINDSGVLAGSASSYTSSGIETASTGFIRNPSGAYTLFPHYDTRVSDINNSGVVLGNYNGSEFIRDASGNITTFTIPGSELIAGSKINDLGVATGFYFGSSGKRYGFLRDPSGNITSFDPASGIMPSNPNMPPNTDSQFSTNMTVDGLNNSGEVVGTVTIYETPVVPEPAGFVLLGVGIVGLLGYGRFRSLARVKA